MKAQRYNPCTPVLNSLRAAGYSTVKVMLAVNAALGELNAVKHDAKLGGGAVQAKKGTYSVTETESVKYAGKVTAPLLFDAWNTQIEKANKIAKFEAVEIPAVFNEWLGKMKAETPAEIKAQADEVPAGEVE